MLFWLQYLVSPLENVWHPHLIVHPQCTRAAKLTGVVVDPIGEHGLGWRLSVRLWGRHAGKTVDTDGGGDAGHCGCADAGRSAATWRTHRRREAGRQTDRRGAGWAFRWCSTGRPGTSTNVRGAGPVEPAETLNVRADFVSPRCPYCDTTDVKSESSTYCNRKRMSCSICSLSQTLEGVKLFFMAPPRDCALVFPSFFYDCNYCKVWKWFFGGFILKDPYHAIFPFPYFLITSVKPSRNWLLHAPLFKCILFSLITEFF